MALRPRLTAVQGQDSSGSLLGGVLSIGSSILLLLQDTPRSPSMSPVPFSVSQSTSAPDQPGPLLECLGSARQRGRGSPGAQDHGTGPSSWPPAQPEPGCPCNVLLTQGRVNGGVLPQGTSPCLLPGKGSVCLGKDVASREHCLWGRLWSPLLCADCKWGAWRGWWRRRWDVGLRGGGGKSGASAGGAGQPPARSPALHVTGQRQGRLCPTTQP